MFSKIMIVHLVVEKFLDFQFEWPDSLVLLKKKNEKFHLENFV